MLIGFSEGANAALEIASQSPMAVLVVVHSCENKPRTFNINCEYRFYYTVQDTTPTRQGTQLTYQNAHACRASIHGLEYVGFEQPTRFERAVLAKRKHIFHNVLPQIEFIWHRAT